MTCQETSFITKSHPHIFKLKVMGKENGNGKYFLFAQHESTHILPELITGCNSKTILEAFFQEHLYLYLEVLNITVLLFSLVHHYKHFNSSQL